MNDQSPWMPPASGEPEPALPEPATDDELTSPPPSPWARPADGDVVEFDTVRPAGVPTDTADGGVADPAPTGLVEPPAVSTSTTSAEPDVVPTVGDTVDQRRRPPLLTVTAVVAVLAIGLAGIFAIRRFTAASAGGGTTPEAVGEQLLSAIEGEDVLGMIDTLLPGEREALGQPFIDTMSELQRLEVLSSDLDLSRLLGVDVELSNEVVSSTPTNVDDIAHLVLGADVVATLDGAALPIGDLVTDRLPSDMLAELRGTSTTETDRFDVDLTVVEFDGRWYVSLLHTAAEAARSGLGGAAIPAEGVTAVGGSSPDDAVDRFLGGISNLDVRSLIQLLDPTEAMALQRYAPLFLDDAEAAVSDFAGSINVVDHRMRFDGSGDRRTAFVESFTAEMAADGETATMTYGGGCWQIESSAIDEPMEMCDDLGLAAIEELDVPIEIQELFDAVTDAFADMADVGIEMREHDGEWFLSPMATVTEAMLAAMRALDRPELDRIIDAVPPALESLLPWVFNGFEELTGDEFVDGWLDDVGIDDPMFDDPMFDDPVFDDPVFDDPVFDDPNFEISPVDRCYGFVDAVEAQLCFEDVLSSGAAEPWEVPVTMRFPECGLTELFWSFDLYEMSDAEFTAAIAGAAPCFDALVAEGDLEQWEVPFEVANLACFEGRNWYDVVDDEFVERAFACMDERGS